MVLEVRDGEDFPADLLCLYCASPNHVCYVKTTNLDGAAQASAWTFTAVLHVKVPPSECVQAGQGQRHASTAATIARGLPKQVMLGSAIAPLSKLSHTCRSRSP